MKNTWLMAVAALLLLTAAACNRQNKAEQLAALDNAYQSGVLSKAEFDAKRLALMGPTTTSAGTPPAAPVAPPVPNSVAPPTVANPVAVPRTPPSDSPPAAAGAVEASQTPALTPAPAPRKPTAHKPSPFVTRSPAASEPPVPSQALPPRLTSTPPSPAQPAPGTPSPAVPPAHEPAPPAAQARPVPAGGAAGQAESEPVPLAGCEDAEYKSGNLKGAQQRFYPASVDSVKRAAGAALRSLDFNIHKDAGNEMEASKRRHISAIVGAGGERLILRFEKAQQGSQAGTLVTGETRKSFVGRVAQKSWTSAVLAQIGCHLRPRR